RPEPLNPCASIQAFCIPVRGASRIHCVPRASHMGTDFFLAAAGSSRAEASEAGVRFSLGGMARFEARTGRHYRQRPTERQCPVALARVSPASSRFGPIFQAFRRACLRIVGRNRPLTGLKTSLTSVPEY